MSVDEDTELRDLVAQTLETNGVLGKIRVRPKLRFDLNQNMSVFLHSSINLDPKASRQLTGLIDSLQFRSQSLRRAENSNCNVWRDFIYVHSIQKELA